MYLLLVGCIRFSWHCLFLSAIRELLVLSGMSGGCAFLVFRDVCMLGIFCMSGIVWYSYISGMSLCACIVCYVWCLFGSWYFWCLRMSASVRCV